MVLEPAELFQTGFDRHHDQHEQKGVGCTLVGAAWPAEAVVLDTLDDEDPGQHLDIILVAVVDVQVLSPLHFLRRVLVEDFLAPLGGGCVKVSFER